LQLFIFNGRKAPEPVTAKWEGRKHVFEHSLVNNLKGCIQFSQAAPSLVLVLSCTYPVHYNIFKRSIIIILPYSFCLPNNIFPLVSHQNLLCISQLSYRLHVTLISCSFIWLPKYYLLILSDYEALDMLILFWGDCAV
jgi:hypothetical protein